MDRYPAHVVVRLFPELKREARSIVRPERPPQPRSRRFRRPGDRPYDFFIANHVIEHLVNPVKFLEKLNAVMAEGSILYLAVPDKRYTFNVKRAVTSSEHLWQDYLRNTQELGDDHLADFLLGTEGDAKAERGAALFFHWLPWNWDRFARKRRYRWHRRRSIHVHVWDQPAFDEFLALAVQGVPLQLSIIDQRRSPDTENHEMLYILQKRAA